MEMEKLTRRECLPAKKLTASYYQGLCSAPLCALTLGQLVDRALKDFPNKQLLHFPEFQQVLTVKEFHDRSTSVAKALLSKGLTKGDLIMLNGIADAESVIITIGAAMIGVASCFPPIFVPPGAFFSQVIEKAKPKILFVGSDILPECIPVVESFISEGNTNFEIVSLGTHFNCFLYSTFIKNGTNVKEEVLCFHKSIVSVDDVAFITLTSTDRVAIRSPTTDDIQFIISVTSALYNCNRTELYILPISVEYRNKDSGEILMTFIEQHGITWLSVYPYELILMINSPKKNNFDLSQLRGASLVSQAFKPQTIEKFIQFFPETMIILGSSEAYATMTSVLHSSEHQRRESVGYGFPHSEVKVVGEDGEILPIGEMGELCIRGWTTFSGYHNPAEITKTNVAGWVKMGDLVRMDETGHVYYIGRVQDQLLLKVESEKVYPDLIIKHAFKLEDVNDAKLVALENEEVGFELCLFVEPKADKSISQEKLKTHFIDQHENYQPSHYFVIQEFPRTGTRDKINNRELKSMAEQLIGRDKKKLRDN